MDTVHITRVSALLAVFQAQIGEAAARITKAEEAELLGRLRAWCEVQLAAHEPE